MLLKNASVLNGVFAFSNLDIEVNNGKIDNLYIQNEYNTTNHDEVLDLSGYRILPGFIDIHTHGCAGYDTMDATYEALNNMSRFMAMNGVTSFLPTTMSETYQSIKNAFLNIRNTIDKGVEGADIVGIHMEGPYFSKQYKGAQNEKFLRLPSITDVTELQELSGRNIRIISIAPEIDGAMEFIKEVSKDNIVISLAHTGADYDTALKAIEYGAKHATHLFNGMAGLNHRAPGIIGAVLDSGLSVELICDGIHLHPAIIRLVYKLAGADKIVLISDSMRAAGLKDDKYDLGGQEIIVKDGVARTKDGNIAGSTVTLLQCLKKVVEFGIRLEDAVKMVTINPAKVIGVDKYKGSIQQGKDADLVVINDRFEVVYTFVKGKVVIGHSPIHHKDLRAPCNA
ncbi:MAG: NagA [Clostridia bacterium]|jgi:N-acetylglucosamine-6-phosphate deacetylase|nr:NagA [Clostridia bacterium]